MKADKYIESMSIAQICRDIHDLIKDKEISYMLVHTHNHYSNDDDQSILFSFCIENLKGRGRVLRTFYRYKKECIDEIIERVLKAKELSEILHIRPLFDNDLVASSIHNSGIVFISLDLIDRIIHTDDDDDILATIYFKNGSNIEIYESEISFLEKILEESGRYDLLI